MAKVPGIKCKDYLHFYLTITSLITTKGYVLNYIIYIRMFISEIWRVFTISLIIS